MSFHTFPRNGLVFSSAFVWLAVIGCSLTSANEIALPGNPSSTAEPADATQPVPNAPGKYLFAHACVPVPNISIDMVQIQSGAGQAPNLVPDTRFSMVTVCIPGVEVLEDSRMRFDVEYSLEPLEDEESEVVRASDRGNRNIFLTDDLGGRYDILESGGCANEEMRTTMEAIECMGWFLFPPAHDGAASFDFHYSLADSSEQTTPSIIEDMVFDNPE
jgi:hypothetical protein